MGVGGRKKTKREFVKVLLTLARGREREREERRGGERRGEERSQRGRERKRTSYSLKSNKDPSGLSTWAGYVVFLMCVFYAPPLLKFWPKTNMIKAWSRRLSTTHPSPLES